MSSKNILIVSLLLVLAACSKVPAGNVGIIVDLYGSCAHILSNG
jgi:hypothetical protein